MRTLLFLFTGPRSGAERQQRGWAALAKHALRGWGCAGGRALHTGGAGSCTRRGAGSCTRGGAALRRGQRAVCGGGGALQGTQARAQHRLCTAGRQGGTRGGQRHMGRAVRHSEGRASRGVLLVPRRRRGEGMKKNLDVQESSTAHSIQEQGQRTWVVAHRQRSNQDRSCRRV